MEFVFWASFLMVFYAYFGYAILMLVWGRISGYETLKYTPDTLLNLTVLVPVHNEETIIKQKIENILQLDYPSSSMEVIFVSDGSTDNTNDIIRSHKNHYIKLVEISDRKGKANALNVGLEMAKHGIIVFSDASIMLDSQALRAISAPFFDNSIGCVSGEDHIQELGGEGAYGRYELWLRNLESKFYSIVGASGSFYAQRRASCKPFEEGMAPDFFSVLNVAEMGYRSVAESRAYGYMTSVKSSRDEFNRKVRTLVRGMSALFFKSRLMNVIKYKRFAFSLISHKLIRWLVPFFLIALFVSNQFLLDVKLYQISMSVQVGFYSLALLASWKWTGLHKSILGKLCLYFSLVNLSILFAWNRYFHGHRQEIWNPSMRD